MTGDPSGWLAARHSVALDELWSGVARGEANERDRVLVRTDDLRLLLDAVAPREMTDRCDRDGCPHERWQHSGRGGRCTDGKQHDTSAWRCECDGFVETLPPAHLLILAGQPLTAVAEAYGVDAEPTDLVADVVDRIIAAARERGPA